ncbi:DNA-binding response regulator [Streptomyces venezuelae]|uniref:DNA-binding response regulator n=1 Tax=Streptomyces venezuelae TaxID=54571 RepID=A0A5P2D4P1_STRVZ|nr:response regulator transcription factor [Streptomyces venezuelae]QES50115.1 DNA-binding response regulator [Streptomyces venezuelae]
MRLVIAEGSAILRAGLAHVLGDRGHELAAAVHDARVLPALVDAHRPDVLIANVRLAPTWDDEGVGAALAARGAHPGTAVLLFSSAPEPQHVARLFAGDGSGLGYLLQDRMTDTEELVGALSQVAGGGTVVDPRMVGALAAGAGARPDGGAATGLGLLSERELEVLTLMAQGRTNSAIAERLIVSAGTVEKRVAAVFDKLNIPGSPGDNRRVLAVLRYLTDRHAQTNTIDFTRERRRRMLERVA